MNMFSLSQLAWAVVYGWLFLCAIGVIAYWFNTRTRPRRAARRRQKRRE